MRSVVVIATAGAVVILSYLGDQWLLQLRIQAAQDFDVTPVAIADSVVRVVLATLVLGLAWMVFQGAGSRVVGAILTIAGLFTLLVPPLWVLNVPVPDFAFAVLGRGVGFLLWTGASITILGLFSIVRPAPPRHRL